MLVVDGHLAFKAKTAVITDIHNLRAYVSLFSRLCLGISTLIYTDIIGMCIRIVVIFKVVFGISTLMI